MPQTEAPGLKPDWEGLIVAEDTRTVIHLAKHSSKEVLLSAIAELNLTPDNLVTLYTSAYLNGKGLDKETWEPDMDMLIQQVTEFANDWRIMRMDVSIRGDITVAVEQVPTASYLIEAQYIRISSLSGAIYVPTGPVVEYGIVNH